MRLTQRFFLFGAVLLAVTLSPAVRADDDPVSVRAILVAASREAGETDRALARYEATLRRILRFESFQQLGSGRDRVALPGEGAFGVGQGQSLRYRAEDAGQGRVRLQLEWQGGSRSFMRTGLVLRSGVPAVLGGPSRPDGGVYALIVIVD
jgi:hypothetical protein